MHKNAEKEINKWVEDLAKNGSNNFNEIAEHNVFLNLHTSAAKLINTNLNIIKIKQKSENSRTKKVLDIDNKISEKLQMQMNIF